MYGYDSYVYLVYTVSPYRPEGEFSMSSLSKLEAANIPVVTSLSETPTQQLVAAAGITLDGDAKETLADEYNKNQ